jgi:hypothetical protein
VIGPIAVVRSATAQAVHDNYAEWCNILAQNPDNAASAQLLEKLGFRYDRHEFYAPTRLDHPSYVLIAHAASRSG